MPRMTGDRTEWGEGMYHRPMAEVIEHPHSGKGPRL